jgi:hypothetical protein
MKEEDKLIRKIGKDNAFKVPDGYFENFTPNLMNKLPEKEYVEEVKPTIWTKMRPWFYMAAVFIGTVLIMRVISFIDNDKAQSAQKPAETEIAQERYIDNAIKSSRLDDYQLYEYLSDAEPTPSK